MRRMLFILMVMLTTVLSYALPPDLLESYTRSYEHHMKAQRWNVLADSARLLEDPSVVYDPSYYRIDYPMGDVPAGTGVCADVVIRAFRKAFGADLQELVHLFLEDQYPDMKLDKNIDHRRVRNLMKYFDAIFDTSKLYNQYPNKFRKGNIVIWDLGGGQLHIGICVEDDMVIHNICCGQVIEPMFMQDKVIRNYSYYPDFFKNIIDRNSKI